MILARLGFAAKGLVYVVVGILAAQAALGGGAPTGSQGALRTIELQPFGQVLLGITAVGTAAYVLWRLASAVFNPDDDGAARRAMHVAVAVVYAGLAFEAARMALGSGSGSGGSGGSSGGSGPAAPGVSGAGGRGGVAGGGEQRAAHWTGEVLAMPLGRWVVGAVGIAVIGYGLYQLYKAVTADVGEELELTAVSSRARRAIYVIGRIGLGARGIVLLVIGWFAGHAALQADAGEVRGLGGALRTLQGEAYGPVLLGVVAVGLIAYGAYQFVRARYRRVGPVSA